VQPAELIRYFQSQLRLRRVYDGPIDGAANAPLKDAVARYREALGLSHEAKLSLDFFKAYLAADHAQVATHLAPPATAPVQVATIAPVPPVSYAAQAPVAPSTTPAPASAASPSRPPATPTSAAPASSLSLHITTSSDPRNKQGRAVQLSIRPNRDAHVYCYMQDKDNQVKRFFPNRFQRDSRVQADGLRLPGAMRFEIGLPPRGVHETVACFATEQDVLARLPDTFNAGDFDALPVASLDQVRTALAQAANGVLAQDTIQLQAK
jgi:hypothetical protein